MSERPHAIPAVAAAVLLIVALGEHSYGYYNLAPRGDPRRDRCLRGVPAK